MPIIKPFLVLILCTGLFLAPAAQDHVPSEEQHSPTELQQSDLQLEEAVFEANGYPLYVLNARARVKNTGQKGYRGSTVHFYCRLDSSQPWTEVGERPLPGVLPGHAVTCDLVTSSEGLPIFNSEGEVSHCQYRVEVRSPQGVSVREGEFHPSCLHDEH